MPWCAWAPTEHGCGPAPPASGSSWAPGAAAPSPPATPTPATGALLAAWADPADAAAFEGSATALGWADIADERLRVALRPLSSRGRWSGREPFAPAPAAPTAPTGPVASITRARLRPTRARGFWRAVPPVAEALARAPGLRLALGIGEAPLLLMGTFSLWSDAAALGAFAHGGAPHRRVMAATPNERWYAEDLFARFAVESVEGTHAGRAP